MQRSAATDLLISSDLIFCPILGSGIMFVTVNIWQDYNLEQTDFHRSRLFKPSVI